VNIVLCHSELDHGLTGSGITAGRYLPARVADDFLPIRPQNARRMITDARSSRCVSRRRSS
jgi:hypothetical protein